MQPHQLLLCSGFLACCAAHAGRPMAVDDAGVDDPGTGHVEAFYERRPGRALAFTLAPFWSPHSGLELGGAISRDRTAGVTAQAIQLKWLLASPRAAGCNSGISAAVSHARGTGNTPAVNGLVSCNSGWGASHFNLGAIRDPGRATHATWGIAHERGFGPVTAHAEAYGQRHGKPVFQVGAHAPLANELQIDASVGRTGGQTLFSAGIVLAF